MAKTFFRYFFSVSFCIRYDVFQNPFSHVSNIEHTLVVNDGTIVVSKEVVINDPALTENTNQDYMFEWYNAATPNDVKNFSIKASETKALTGLTPGATYVFKEVNIPNGYTPRNNPIEVTLTNTAAAVEAVHFVNDYESTEVKPNLTVSGTKTLNGRDWKEGDSFTFKLQALQGANWVDLAERTVAYNATNTKDDYKYTFNFADDAELRDLAIEIAGVHYFRVIEVVPTAKPGGVTYDEAYRYFSVTVTDADMNGALEIASVNGVAPVTVSSDNSGATVQWAVDVDFTNTYAASGTDDLVITIDKTVTDNVGANTGKDGFTFGLYTVGGTSLIVTSEPTDANGHTSLTLSFPAAYVGHVYNFEIREIVPENKLKGMDYDPAVYPVGHLDIHRAVERVGHHDLRQILSGVVGDALLRLGGILADDVVVGALVCDGDRLETELAVRRILRGTDLFAYGVLAVGIDRRLIQLEGELLILKALALNKLGSRNDDLGGICRRIAVVKHNVTVGNTVDRDRRLKLALEVIGDLDVHLKLGLVDRHALAVDLVLNDDEVVITDGVEGQRGEGNLALTIGPQDQLDVILQGVALNEARICLVQIELKLAVDQIATFQCLEHLQRDFDVLGLVHVGEHERRRKARGIDVAAVDLDLHVELAVVIGIVGDDDRHVILLAGVGDAAQRTGLFLDGVVVGADGAKLQRLEGELAAVRLGIVGCELRDGLAVLVQLERKLIGVKVAAVHHLRANEGNFRISRIIDVREAEANALNVRCGCRNDRGNRTVEVVDDLDGHTVDDKAAESIRFNNVFTEVFKKKVILTTKPEVNIDGESVAYGDVLTYVIEYTNAYDTAHADVMIIDTIPVGTVLVEGTATEGAVYNAENGTLTWKKTVPAKTTWTVKFDVKVVEGGEEITNAARAFYGENEYITNEVVTTSTEKPEPEPPVESPQTGDSGNLALWIALLFVSGGVLFGTMKKKEKEQA